MAAILLRPAAHITNYLQTTTLPYYPYPITTFLHAARISLVFRSRVRKNSAGGSLPWTQDLAGFLLMCWGGALLTHFALCLPAPQLTSHHPWVAYSTVHILLSVLPFSPDPMIVDLAAPLFDGILRSGAITAAVNLAAKHPNPAVSESIFAQLMIGAIASAGGGLVATTLNVFEPDWSIRTPFFLKSPTNGLLGTLELWSGVLAAFVYGAMTMTTPAYEGLYEYAGLNAKAIATPLGGRAAVVLVLAPIYFARAVLMHWPRIQSLLGNAPVKVPEQVPVGRKSNKKNQ